MKSFFGENPLMRRVVASGALVGIGWIVYSLSIASQQEREREFLGRISDLTQRIDTARKSIQEIKQQEQAAAGVRGVFQRLERDIPTGSVLAWFPNRMKAHFDRLGVHGSVTRLNTTLEEPEMSDYERTYWAVDIPLPGTPGDISSVVIAVADLEGAEPTVKVLDLAIRQEYESARRTAVINVTALTRR